jgi:alpha-glucosidase
MFKGRDGCRTPMPWDGTKPNLGFTTGTPWLPPGEGHAALGVAAQEADRRSPLHYARALLAARRATPALREGMLTLLDAPPPLIAFRRESGEEKLLCVFNLGRTGMGFSDPALAHAEPLAWGCGEAAISGMGLTLGPLSAWFGRL